MNKDAQNIWSGQVRLIGVDFTSAPRARKPITVASGHLSGHCVFLESLETCPDWPAFEAVLARPGPWLGGFDFPFGLPREAVLDLGWPLEWAALIRHCTILGRERFRTILDEYRQTRPAGQRYAHRRTDLPARSHSPLKLVNPPVGLMFFEGTPRLLEADVTVAGMHCADPARVAVEAYPGLLARSITLDSYKSDEKRKQTSVRHEARKHIAVALREGAHPLRLRLAGDSALIEQIIADASGDLLDATLALVQAGWSLQAGPPNFGLQDGFDPLEGWIAGLA
ncbi:DUF429 domain-containing protein [Parazoarcus communis]|uniref:DUF429 domain-containing protein n=1 Tax=Parazoarcus communis TaxID=41977 RepID=A0A2U8H5C8_9RHOO|nr:DUF429 domain-containing protein [Parazoarcus communis]AWI80864.1 DUF429 domain-containing protein [Parazoarcus communis]